MTRRVRRLNPEEILHRAVADYLRVALRPPTIWTTFPAGGGGKARGGRLKAMGLTPGWPDILVVHYHKSVDFMSVVGLELKTKTGRQSPEQKSVQKAFDDAHLGYAICRSVEDVECALDLLSFPLHATVRAAA